MWQALVLGTRDYVRRNGFEEVIVALSGGLDSALVATIAADALGGEHVIGLLLPSPYSSEHSLVDAKALADNLGIRTHEIGIGRAMSAFDDMFAAVLAAEGHTRADDGVVSVTEENIQSRIRGLAVMAVSNDSGALVLTTGNKSEYAVGYATLYGDMNGGYGPIKDVPKTMAYDLARYRASLGASIPQNTIDKPPSAELRPDQTDQDALPDYDVLDDIVARYVEHNEGGHRGRRARRGGGPRRATAHRPVGVQAPAGRAGSEGHHQGLRQGAARPAHPPLARMSSPQPVRSGSDHPAGIAIMDSG